MISWLLCFNACKLTGPTLTKVTIMFSEVCTVAFFFGPDRALSFLLFGARCNTRGLLRAGRVMPLGHFNKVKYCGQGIPRTINPRQPCAHLRQSDAAHAGRRRRTEQGESAAKRNIKAVGGLKDRGWFCPATRGGRRRRQWGACVCEGGGGA